MQRALVLALCVLCAGCLVSEQEGTTHTLYNPDQDGKGGNFAIHFGSPYNKAVVFGRSALLALLGLWFVAGARGARGKLVPVLFGASALAGGAWLLNQDLPTVLRYRISVGAAELRVDIPPAQPREIPWGQVQGMTVQGTELGRGSRPLPAPVPFGAKPQHDPLDDLADWKTLELKIAGDEVLVIDLSRLSLEQRMTVFRSIATRARLVEVAR